MGKKKLIWALNFVPRILRTAVLFGLIWLQILNFWHLKFWVSKLGLGKPDDDGTEEF